MGVCFGIICAANYDLTPHRHWLHPHVTMRVLGVLKWVPPLPPSLPCLVPGHPSNRRSLYRLPSPWILLRLATNTAAVVGVKKLVSAPNLAVKEMCVFVVCLFTKCVLLSLAVIDIMGWVVCVCVWVFSLVETLVEMQAKPPCCSLIGWMTGRECDGRSTINFPVVGKGHGVMALWSTIKRTRQIGWGAPVRGRARRAGPDKDGDGDAASHNSGSDKSPATAPWHHSNTSTHTQPHWHAYKH